MNFVLEISCFFILILAVDISPANAVGKFPDGRPYPDGFEDCLKSSNAKLEEVLNKPKANISEEVYCFFKCLSERVGFIDQQGNVHIDKMDVTQIFQGAVEEVPDELKSCLGGVNKVESCQDMSKICECFLKMAP
uniref:Odorant binding protein 8 n=1 Tax=Colaphellus bowringi TaxID=561076 RepID=A0A0S3J3A3_9CUCU|nr:odorant binding protein 8 [Colaphellus bowringi]